MLSRMRTGVEMMSEGPEKEPANSKEVLEANSTLLIEPSVGLLIKVMPLRLSVLLVALFDEKIAFSPVDGKKEILGA